MMKAHLFFLLVCCLVGGCCGTASASEPLSLPWRAYTLEVGSIRINPDNIENDHPDTDQYVVVRMVCPSEGVAIREIAENLPLFCLEDAQGDTYDVKAFMPYNMIYGEQNGVFMTAPLQRQFDLFFILPAGMPVRSMTMQTDAGALSFQALPEDLIYIVPDGQ